MAQKKEIAKQNIKVKTELRLPPNSNTFSLPQNSNLRKDSRPCVDINSYDLRERKIKNLVILSATDYLTAQSAYKYFKSISKMKDLAAISLELDQSFQSVLNDFFERGKKFNYATVPGFAYAINYGINKKILLYASDKFQKDYFRKINDLDKTLQNSIQSKEQSLPNLIKSWEQIYDSFDNQRAKATSQNLKNLIKTTSGKVAHLCSEEQALKIEKFI